MVLGGEGGEVGGLMRVWLFPAPLPLFASPTRFACVVHVTIRDRLWSLNLIYVRE